MRGPPKARRPRPGEAGAAADLRRQDTVDPNRPEPKTQDPVQLVPFRRLPGRHRRFLLRAAGVHGQRRIESVLAIMPEARAVSIADVLDGRYVGVVLVSTVERYHGWAFVDDGLTKGAFGYGAPVVAAFESRRDAEQVADVFRRTRRAALDQIAIRETGERVQ